MTLAHQHMVWLEAHRHPVLDWVFIALTYLGSEAFLLLFGALGYWLWNRRWFARLVGMVLVAAMINTLLKALFMAPRPSVSHVVEASGWSFPSGHAQVSAVLWGWLAVEILRAYPTRRRVAQLLWCVSILVALSRPYLGVHYIHDILVGWILGVVQVFILAYVTHERRGGTVPRWFQQGLWLLWMMALGLSLGGIDSVSSGMMMRLLGASVGLGVGISWSVWMGWTKVPTSWNGRFFVTGVGVAGVLGVWIGLKKVIILGGGGEIQVLALMRYVLLTLWVVVVTPAVASFGDEGATPSTGQ